MATLDRITFDPKVCGGKACIRGMGFMVSVLLNYLAAGMTREEILDEFPELESADIDQCLMYAADLAEEWSYVPLRTQAVTR